MFPVNKHIDFNIKSALSNINDVLHIFYITGLLMNQYLFIAKF